MRKTSCSSSGYTRKVLRQTQKVFLVACELKRGAAIMFYTLIMQKVVAAPKKEGVPLSNIKVKKTELRNELLTVRDSVDEEVWTAADAQIRANLQALPAFQEAQTVFCYISMDTEIDTLLLIEEMLKSGKTVCAPRCAGKHVMHAYLVNSLDELEDDPLGIPSPAAESPLVAPETIDLVIVPCLTCDDRGNRLGYGGGYYDCYCTSATNAVKAILCRERFRVASLPSEPHDVPADIIVTDKGTVFLS